ncbi:MAG: ABC transporter ATP-binding protein [Gemmataceae bacterium]|nr:ABC transporter ATP-binding protein [Gemmataceae bacterium]
MAEVVLDHVGKVYPPDVHALRDVTLHVADGELMVLVGPSGCGKTTTLRLIAGLERPSGGSLQIGQRDVTRVPPYQRDVAMVFQRHALYPHLSVRQNLRFGLQLTRPLLEWFRSSALDEARVHEAARLLDLENVLNRRPGELSGGQQQRVALGRALVRQPSVFLLDEPLSHLDAELRTEVRRELHLLQRRLRATMIYVTHDSVEAMTLADRVAVLDGGRLQQADVPAVVYQRPCNRRVAGFFGWPPMNLFEGNMGGTVDRPSFLLPAAKLEWTLPGSWTATAGQRVTLGIRPQDVRVLTEYCKIEQDVAGFPPFRTQVMRVEPIGSGSLLRLECDGLHLVSLTDEHAMVREGSNVDVALAMTRTHLFDASTGQSMRQEVQSG